MTNETSAKFPKWKIAVFAAVIILIAGIAIYSLMSKNTSTATAASNNNAAPSAVANASNTQAKPGIEELNWVKNISTRFADHAFVFVILPGNNDATEKVAGLVGRTAATIQEQGVNVDTVTLNSSDPELKITTDRLAITQLPAVLAFASSGNGAFITGEITETKLLQAYLVVSRTCVPGASSGCCPSN